MVKRIHDFPSYQHQALKKYLTADFKKLDHKMQSSAQDILLDAFFHLSYGWITIFTGIVRQNLINQDNKAAISGLFAMLKCIFFSFY